LAAFRRAQSIQPMATNISDNIGMTYYYAGRYPEAIAQLETPCAWTSGLKSRGAFSAGALCNSGNSSAP
jgi:hypothetical protein